VGVLVAGTVKLFFLVARQMGMKFGKKRQSLSCIEP